MGVRRGGLPVITDGASQPLDVGRRTKVVPQPLRRALAVRDGGCAFVGCDRPPGWCDAHHVHHRADGGPTALDNLVLLCRAHHRAVHRGFGVAIVEGRPRFTRPDGTPIEDRAPPSWSTHPAARCTTRGRTLEGVSRWEA